MFAIRKKLKFNNYFLALSFFSLSITASAFSFKFNLLNINYVILNQGTYRTFSDGSLAASCNNYKNPTGKYRYSGAVGDGIYRINSAGNIFNVYCDMTNQGGGWTLVYKDSTASTLLSSTTTNYMAQSSDTVGTPNAPSQGSDTYKANSVNIAHTQTMFRADLSGTGLPSFYRTGTMYLIKNAALSTMTGTTIAACGNKQFDNGGCDMEGMDFDYWSVTGGPIAQGALGRNFNPSQTLPNGHTVNGAYWFGDTTGSGDGCSFTAYSSGYQYMWHASVPTWSDANGNATKCANPATVYRSVFLR